MVSIYFFSHYLRQVLEALSFCHENRIIHRDLKVKFTLHNLFNPLSPDKLHVFANDINKLSRENTECKYGALLGWPCSTCSCAKARIGIACENIRFSTLFAAGYVSRGGTSATQQQKFHTDDANQCLLNKSGSHGVPNVNLFNFRFLLVDLVKCCVHLQTSSSKF